MPAHKKPVKQHILEGTFRPSRHAQLAGTFETLTIPPACPKSIISKKARAAWADIIPRLTESGRLAPEDLPGLEIAFRALGLSAVLMDTIEDLDAINDTSKIRMLSSVAHQNASLFVDILARFGFSTKGRENIIQTLAVKNAREEKSLIDELLDSDEEGN